MEGTKQKGLKASVQKLGSFLSSMVMPNIGAFIAWGLITALFIADGYLPNEQLASMVDPMLKYLLPLLIGYTGGKMVYEQRGAVVGAIATCGVIVGADIPMFIGAMIMGPLGGYFTKQFDVIFKDKVKAGFEMLVNNFSAGIIGMLLAILAYYGIGPIVVFFTNALASGVQAIVSVGLLPLANVLIEPAKILFLNNAINHGILTPLGLEQSAELGKSVFFLLEANPGPGLGVLLAFTLFGKGSSKSSAPGAIIIHFLGGIHEIYFPYVMMKPLLLLAVMAGGITGTFIFQLLGAGLVAASSPGSILAIMAMSPRGAHIPVLAGVIGATIVSFLVASVILKADKSAEIDLEEAQSAIQSAKSESKGIEGPIAEAADYGALTNVIFACDAGMGSSAMGASVLRNKMKEAGLTIPVTNSAINNLKDDPNTLVVTQEELAVRAKKQAPRSTFVTVGNFMNSPKYDEIVNRFAKGDVDVPAGVEDVVVETAVSDIASYKNVDTIYLVYDANQGSSTMGASLLRNLLKKMDRPLIIQNLPITDLKDQKNVVVLSLASTESAAKAQAPSALHITVDNFVDESAYDKLKEQL